MVLDTNALYGRKPLTQEMLGERWGGRGFDGDRAPMSTSSAIDRNLRSGHGHR